MWTTRRALRAENAELLAENAGLIAQLLAETRRHDDARDDAETEREAREEAVRLLADATERLRVLEAQHAALQRRYDAAVGMDAPGVEAGRGWQSRRPDRTTAATAAPKPTSTTVPLPRREPGEAAS